LTRGARGRTERARHPATAERDPAEYPPSLAQVLRLDPSLMTREGNLTPYWHCRLHRAASGLSRDPAFPRATVWRQQRPGRFAGPGDSSVWRRDELFHPCWGFVAFFLMVGFLARLLVDHRRWLRATKTQTDTHTKLMIG
jgi:hypothetical protein